MAQVIPNQFTTYELSPREQAEGKQLNINQRCVIQNRLSAFAQEKLAWTFDPRNPEVCMQREAELQGQIRLLQLMLDEAIEAESLLLTMAREA